VRIDAAVDGWSRIEPLAQHHFSDAGNLVGLASIGAADEPLAARRFQNGQNRETLTGTAHGVIEIEVTLWMFLFPLANQDVAQLILALGYGHGQNFRFVLLWWSSFTFFNNLNFALATFPQHYCSASIRGEHVGGKVRAGLKSVLQLYENQHIRLIALLSCQARSRISSPAPKAVK